VSQITREGGKAIAIQADVSKAADVKRMFEETKKALGSVDVLVNNAGVFQFDPLEAITDKEFYRKFDINVLRMILSTQEALNYFPRSGGQHRQYQFHHQRESGAEFGALLGHQGRD
jgi:3-oxoacyl-[acyl-carrier protein] reductase